MKIQIIDFEGDDELQLNCTVNLLILPLIPFEFTWNRWVHLSVYLAGLVYFFMGVAIASDIFMSAIEFILSDTKKVPFIIGTGPNQVKMFVDVTIWNSTVANLTLMALGSSAPEILLSIIEITGNDFESGNLGPGTIVGSAAFNLLFITAMCVVAVPNGETRRIDIFRVFIITSFFSCFAYIWMLVVLEFVTPCIVDIWEAVITLFCFPLLVFIAWWADCHFCITGRKGRSSFDEQVSAIQRLQGETHDAIDNDEDEHDAHHLYVNGQLDHNALINFYKKIRETADVTDEEAASLVAAKLIESKEHSRLWYRIGACRGLMGGSKLTPVLNQKLHQVYDVLNAQIQRSTGKAGTLRQVQTTPEIFRNKAIFEFQAASFAVPESIGSLTVTVQRKGRADNEVTVRVTTVAGTAKEGSDFEKVDTELVFEPFVYEQNISVRILDDNKWEPDESFFLRLTMPDRRDDAMIGQTNPMEITIIDDDVPGKVSFCKHSVLVNETAREVPLEIERTNGSDGDIKIKYRTFPNTNGPKVKHPHPIEGTIIFLHGETKKFITIPLLESYNSSKGIAETFDVELYGPDEGVILGALHKCSVTISDDEKFNNTVSKVVEMAEHEVETVSSPSQTYSEQIRAAFSVNGGNLDEASNMDFILHFITLGWKILFSFIPPATLLGGWPCFVLSLASIGVLTAFIGDFASMIGCLVGMNDTITAITLVALGTSLPDTFASMSAAKHEKSADNAIGNVTGSNSVNVFLGLGIPWTVASLYHFSHGTFFAVDPRELGFSVFVYTSVSFLAISILVIRRYSSILGQAELGGPIWSKVLTSIFLVSLWVCYVSLSYFESIGLFQIKQLRVECPQKVKDHLKNVTIGKALEIQAFLDP